MTAAKRVRCAWVNTNELFVPYHDREWGVSVHDDRMLFEMLNLEGAQAGLSWLTILKKREHYRKVFDNFNAKKIAKYTPAKKVALLKDAGIVRNWLKVNAFVENAKAFLEMQKEFGSFDAYTWQFVQGKTIPHKKRNDAIGVSEVMSKDMKKRGFKFVGATICFAFMQAVGMVNDHTSECFRSR